ncbi:MAG TPA: hypothetical protein VIG06_05100 [Kofleriaceae bacterium]|jgi:hypothetical protein
MKNAILAAALAALAACSAEPAPRTAAPAAPHAAAPHATAPTAAARCGDGPILYEVVSQGVGADTRGYTLYSPSRAVLRQGGAFRIDIGAWSHEGCVSAAEELAFTRALAAARFTGGSTSCGKKPHVDILVRDAARDRDVSYQLFSASIDDPCGPLPDASVIELGRLFSTMTLEGAPDMPA